MRIILLQDIETLGKTGSQCDVKDGYARNYLIPRGFALKASPVNIKRFQEINRLKESAKKREMKKVNELADKLKALSLTIPVQVGEEDRLFGAVTSQSIAEQLQEKGYEIDKRQILLEEPIKTLGVFDVPVKLHPEVTATVKVWVVKA